eukprot:Protomagalhaensia_wolfi_Nauph_80__229@NODE_1129_length_1708_cov_252_212103_g861_i0_p1_GENE_NODE_1129_length_1708_cov_252_212103_g861_i0NODE_1129_length_1708_cov_252_212103_g861_i0_p1_ORF_typecomplete_len434_score94_19CRTlike/PF08627_10/1_9e03CRTlike/PF08627_10/2_1e29SLC35F/PF06027_12/8_8e02SLC35F/PF06027_12/5_9e29Nuc_sug_transp/PF04142_15/7_2e02Nuc_sug_transp/PF04142_15/1e23UAA/PF08449_11/2_5e14TPT/PF03151_16/4_8e14PUNUT/PF16913_5/6_1e11EamA/PF00892_20/6_5e02EamA/PF00892_20/1_2e06EamA/PF00892_20
MSSSHSIERAGAPAGALPPPQKASTPPTHAGPEPAFEDVDPHAGLPALHQYPVWIKWIAAFVCFSSGCVSSYSFKIMNKQQVRRCGDLTDPDCDAKSFNGPFLQTLIMFFGEMLCLFLWMGDEAINKKKSKVPWSDFTLNHKSFVKRDGKWWGWALPSFLDFIATVMSNIALTITYASTVTMLRNTFVVVAALLQLILIRRALRVHEWIGVITVSTAMVLTAIPAILRPEDASHSAGEAALGVILAVLSTVFQAIQMVFEEFLFTKWRYSPIKAVGMEGCTGIVYTLIAFPIVHATGMENVKHAWYQWANDSVCLGITFLFLAACILFNGGGLATTKLGGALLRGIVRAGRAPAIWIVDLIVGWIAYDNYNLISVFIFIIGFSIHARMWPAEKFPRWHKVMSTPWHWCCTKPELDEGYEPPTDKPLIGEEENV